MVDISNLQVVVGYDDSAVQSGVGKTSQTVEGLGSKIQSALGAAAIGAVAGLGAAFVGSVKSAVDFEKQISAISAVSGATESELDGLRATALQLGKDTSFSASEAAAGMEEMVKAGVSLADVMGGAGRAALDLAAAGGLSVAESATIASDAMNVFSVKGSDMAHVADVIAGAANASSIDVHQFGFSLSAVGAVAATVGLGLEDTATAIAVLGQAGLKGADAGTSLKTMLLNLSPATDKAAAEFNKLGLTTFNTTAAMELLRSKGIQPVSSEAGALADQIAKQIVGIKDWATATQKQRDAYDEITKKSGVLTNAFFDETGKVKSLADVAGILQKAMKGLTEEQQLSALQTLFGTDAIRAAAIMAKAGADGFTKMAEEMSKVTAQAVAQERLNNVAGSLETLKGSIETAAIMLGSLFLPAIKRTVDNLTSGVNQAIEIIGQIPDAVETVKQVLAGDWSPADSIAPFVNEVGKAAAMLRDTFGPAITVVGGYLQQLGDWLGANVAPIAAFVAGFLGAIAAAGVLSSAITAVAAVLALLLSPLGLVAVAVGLLAAAWVTDFMGIQEQTAAFWAFLQPLLQQLGDWLGPKITAVLTWLTSTGWPAMLAAGQAVSEWITGTAIPALTQLVDWLGPKLVAVTTWISGTGWPALVTAGTAVGTMVAAVIKFFTDLFTELEKRGVFTELGTIWNTLVEIGGRVWDILQKIAAAFLPVIEAVAKLMAAAAMPALNAAFGFLAEKASAAGGPVGIVAAAIDTMAKAASGALGILNTMLATLQKLSEIKITLPSFGNGSGGGIPGLEMQSYRPGGAGTGTRAVGGGGGGQVNQFNLGLSPGDAEAACGPAALAWFMNMNGRTPTGSEALALARNAGWDRNTGMYGPGAFRAAASAAGVPTTSASRSDIDSLAAAGQPFVLSTPGHYFQVSGGSAAGGLNVGGSGQALRGGSGVMTLQQIEDLMGTVQDVIVPQIKSPAMNPADLQKTLSGGPGASPSDWPGFMQQTFEQLPAYLQSLDTIQQAGTEAFTAVGQAGTEQGQVLVTASTDAFGNVTRIYSEGGIAVGATITDTGGQIVQSWGAAGQQMLASTQQNNSAVLADYTGTFGALVVNNQVTGAQMVADTTTAGAATIASWTDWTGQVVTTHAAMAAGVATQGATMHAELIRQTTDSAGQTTTIWREQSGQITTIVTDMAGQVVHQFTTAGDGAKKGSEGVKSFTDALGNIKVPDLGGVVQGFDQARKAAQKAADAVEDFNKALGSSRGGSKSGGGNNPFGKAAGGPVDIGRTYLVGEEGPELFTPSSSGTIIPNGRLNFGGGGGIMVNVEIHGSLVAEHELDEVIASAVSRSLRSGSVGLRR